MHVGVSHAAVVVHSGPNRAPRALPDGRGVRVVAVVVGLSLAGLRGDALGILADSVESHDPRRGHEGAGRHDAWGRITAAFSPSQSRFLAPRWPLEIASRDFLDAFKRPDMLR